jgi:hypothetical protein
VDGRNGWRRPPPNCRSSLRANASHCDKLNPVGYSVAPTEASGGMIHWLSQSRGCGVEVLTKEMLIRCIYFLSRSHSSACASECGNCCCLILEARVVPWSLDSTCLIWQRLSRRHECKTGEGHEAVQRGSNRREKHVTRSLLSGVSRLFEFGDCPRAR